MKRREGFTLAELIFVIGIIVLLAALLVPIYRKVKSASYIAESKSNLHQLQLQTSIYQSDNNGDAQFGDSYKMGLPPYPFAEISTLRELKPPLAPSRSTPILGATYYTMYLDPTLDHLDPTWATYAQTAQENAVLYVDPFNNDPRFPLDQGTYLSRRLLGVTVGGALVDVNRPGDWLDRSWWLANYPS